ncbi:hypothetical protein BDV95DRAFT_651876 [Massariosphaeria phaeospora]|uniref:Uncharacterized protein n=1 Tax=Massariosphaeria phaeospora TaxID=100035 RepID=A0A7C8M221_9PLEO|nr:hypothetical protein BDV95DRAFT_651876 [Massariosphaeria phaeospora]
MYNVPRCVCKIWYINIEQTHSIQRTLWKRAQTSKESHPHSTPPTIEQQRYTSTNGEPLLAFHKRAFLRLLNSNSTEKDWSEYKHRASSIYMHNPPVFSRVMALSGDSKNVNCGQCCILHLGFRFENIHPLLIGLRDLDICMQGHGSEIYINLGLWAGRVEPGFSSYRTVPVLGSKVSSLCSLLKNTSEIARTCHLERDLFTRPMCTRLVAFFREEILETRNENGITLHEAVAVIARAVCRHLRSERDSMHDQHIFFQWTWEEISFAIPTERLLWETEGEWDDYAKTSRSAAQLLDNTIRDLENLIHGP